jgi:hypothetical protein
MTDSKEGNMAAIGDDDDVLEGDVQDAEAGAGAMVAGGVFGSTIGPGGIVGGAGAGAGAGVIASDLVDTSGMASDPDTESSPDSFAGSGPEKAQQGVPGDTEM